MAYVMTVYVVLKDWPSDESEVLGIYTSRERAEAEHPKDYNIRIEEQALQG